MVDDQVTIALAGALAGRADIEVALLFGSCARGTARAASDVDVAVLAHGVDLLALALHLSNAMGREVDVVDLRRAGVPLLEQVLRDGVLVHEGKRHQAAAWRARALASLETDRPWYTRMEQAMLRRLASGGA